MVWYERLKALSFTLHADDNLKKAAKMRQNGEAYDLPEMWCQTSSGKHDLSNLRNKEYAPLKSRYKTIMKSSQIKATIQIQMMIMKKIWMMITIMTKRMTATVMMITTMMIMNRLIQKQIVFLLLLLSQ